jgi:uncharacterized protein
MRALLFSALLVPGTMLAQGGPASGTYRLFQGGSEVGRETFQRTDSLFEQTSTIPALNLKIESGNARDAEGRFAGFSLSLRNAAGDTLLGTYQARLAGDSVRLSSTLPKAPPGRTRPANFDLVMPPQSVASLAELVVRAAGRDTTWRLLMAGSDSILVATVRFSGDSARVKFAGIEVLMRDSAGGVAWLEIPVQRARAVLAPPDEALPPLPGGPRPKPDFSAPPDAPYTAEEVRVPVTPETGDTFSLGCTLSLPKAAHAPFPAAVTITGSGLQGRDEDLWPRVPGYRIFRQVADRLARAGWASLRCDDRGKDASGGNPETATTVDLAGDTRAQVTWLRARAEIDRRRVVLIGHSEGGIIGPMLAAEDQGIAALVVLAAPAKPGSAILRDQARWPILTQPDLSPEARDSALATADSSVRADSAAPGAWFQWFYHYDPLPVARRVRQPTLIMQGALDRQVSAGQADTLARTMRAGGNRQVTVRVFPELNHLFLHSPTDGSPSEYSSLKDTMVPAQVLDTMVAWLRRQVR